MSLNLVLSVLFPDSLSVTLVVSILCCQSFSVIDSCFVSHFFSLFFCHLCGLLFCESFFLTLSLSLLWSQSCVVNHSVSLTLVSSVHFSDSFFVSILCCQSLSVIDSCFCLSFSSLIFCHLCGLNLVLLVVLCHWLLFCESFFLIISLSLLWSQYLVLSVVLCH